MEEDFDARQTLLLLLPLFVCPRPVTWRSPHREQWSQVRLPSAVHHTAHESCGDRDASISNAFLQHDSCICCS